MIVVVVVVERFSSQVHRENRIAIKSTGLTGAMIELHTRPISKSVKPWKCGRGQQL